MRTTTRLAATRSRATTSALQTMPLKERRFMPLLSATGPVQEQNRDVNDPAEGAHGPISPRPRGRSRLGCRCPSWPCCTVLIPRANTPRSSGESWSILPGTPTLRSELFGSDGARQGFPPTRRRCAALTRAMRSRCSGQLSERRRALRPRTAGRPVLRERDVCSCVRERWQQERAEFGHDMGEKSRSRGVDSVRRMRASWPVRVHRR